MRIVVDLNRCQGYAQCVPLAPDVLKMHGEEALAYDPNPDDSQRQEFCGRWRPAQYRPSRSRSIRPADRPLK